MKEADRQRVAGCISSLHRCETTNYEFEESVTGVRIEKDPALAAILGMVWTLYSDQYEHRLDGAHRPDPGTDAMLQRCEAFLRTSLPYEWPYTDFEPPPLHLKWLVEAARGSIGTRIPPDENIGELNPSVWPFAHESDWYAARDLMGVQR